jgi:hypothetical protein
MTMQPNQPPTGPAQSGAQPLQPQPYQPPQQFQQPQPFPPVQPQQPLAGQPQPQSQPVAMHPQQPAHHQLATMVSGSQEVLCKATTVFPFVLFPDTIIVDREKVTISHKSFFKTGDTLSTHIDDILSVSANVGPLFGSIKLTIRNIPNTNPPHIEYLSRKDVLCIKNILQGYIIARQNNVDCASLPKDQLIHMLQDLGNGKPLRS